MAKWAHTIDRKPKALLQFPLSADQERRPYITIIKRRLLFL